MLPNKIYEFLQICIKNLLETYVEPWGSKMSKMAPDSLETYSF